MLSLQSYPKKKERFPWRIIEDETVLVDVEEGEVIHLNETATSIWEVIDGCHKVSEIIEHIYNIFEVEQTTAKQEVLEFLNYLAKKNIIEY